MKLRCAFCHGAADGATACASCGVLLHDDCRALTSTCPTIGCRGSPRAAASPPSAVPGVDLSTYRKGLTYRYAMQDRRIQLVRTITDVAATRIQYEEVTLMDRGQGPAPTGEPARKEWAVPAEVVMALLRKTAGSTPGRETHTVSGRVLDCRVVSGPRDRSVTVIVQDGYPVFPCVYRSTHRGTVDMQLTSIE